MVLSDDFMLTQNDAFLSVYVDIVSATDYSISQAQHNECKLSYSVIDHTVL